MSRSGAVVEVEQSAEAFSTNDLSVASCEYRIGIDEVVVEVQTESARHRFGQFKSILGANDPRCPGLPIECECFLSDKYTKDENYMAQFIESVRQDAELTPVA